MNRKGEWPFAPTSTKRHNQKPYCYTWQLQNQKNVPLKGLAPRPKGYRFAYRTDEHR